MKPLDKGGATVIKNRSVTKNAIENEEFYKPLQDDPYKNLKRDYNKPVQNEERGLKEGVPIKAGFPSRAVTESS